ncbi:hypothetical protein [Piscinibacter gummiphilus]|uniref:Uncharacterized protein n=1 Tax=Piscinibacter gummiphilus TaxID=946333 RepID=A0A1W6L903_9BURK|nr:hypothetical protein [Piscinibacter gummiphilus]ARN20799.1 hypothetical protein A4W93_13325 [Piscinibacter gummiphilus]ATU65475.1 hypothetical protein CPZ87_13405 [Piscinibacter gummiphilus]GLS94631.1 hypothetical protein GCM10007918_19230 [Piscinibacter gummiphilus]
MPPPTVSRPGTPPITTQTTLPPPTDPSSSSGTTTRPSGNNALVRFQGTQALPNRRPSVTGTEAATSTAATSSTNAVATTRRRTNAALTKVQTERAAAELAQQIHQLAMREIGSLEPAAVQAYFESNVSRLMGAQAPAQQRLLRLFAQARVPDGERIVTDAMQALDRTMTAALGGGEGASTALQRASGPMDQAALQRFFDVIDQMRGAPPPVPLGGDTRIEEVDTDSTVTRTTDDTSVSGADSDASVRGHFPAEEVESLVAKLTEAIKATPEFLAKVMNNRDFDTKTAQWLATTGNVFLRNLASVGVTTFGREFLAYGIELALERQGVSVDVRRGLSALTGPGYATLTHMVGAYRDVMDGGASKEDLRNALIGRGVSVATALAAFFAEDALGLSHTTTATHAAMTAYTHARDVGVQSWLRLPAARDPAEDKTHFMFMSVFYGIDQFIVPMLMLLAAPNSGARAARNGVGLGDLAKAATIRAGLNTAGEMAEDLANEGNRAIRAGHAPEVGLQVDFKQRHFVNGLLGPQSVRTAIISEAQSFVPIIAAKMDGKSDMQVLMVTALMIGLINGIQYWPFAKGFSAQPKVAPPPSDLESALGSDSASQHELSDLSSTESLQIEELDDHDPRLVGETVTTPTEVIEPDDGSTRRAA